MPIIYTYPTATPTTEDLLLISDVSATNPTKATRKCTVGSLVALVGALVPGGGTVTSVGLQPGTTGFSIATTTVNPITASGVFTIEGTLVCNHGGTGLATADYTNGDILYYDSGASTTQLQTLGIGGANEVLTVNAGVPDWRAASTVALSSLTLDFQTTGLLSGGASSETINTSGGTFDVSGVLVVANGGTGANTFAAKPLKGAGGTGAVTASDVILTAGGTQEVTGILPVVNGGTGVATFTDGGILIGNAATDVQVTARPTAGQVLIGTTALDPVCATLTAGTGISISSLSGAITITSLITQPSQIAHNTLSLRGGSGGTLVPNIHRKGVYWKFGDYVYLQFYLEWDIAGTGPPSGTVIMENLPGLGINPVAAAEDQGSCLITVNTGWGLNHASVAPTVGRPGVTGADEIIFRGPNYNSGGSMTDTEWTFQQPDYAGPWVLAGTAWWLEPVA